MTNNKEDTDKGGYSLQELEEILSGEPVINELDDQEVEQVLKNNDSANSFIVSLNEDDELLIENTLFDELNLSWKSFNESSQLKQDRYGTKFKVPPYPYEFIAYLSRINWIFRECCEKVARDCVRNGYDVVTRNGITSDEDIQAEEEIKTWLENMPISFNDVIEDVIKIGEKAGAAGVEIIRENGLDSPIQWFKPFDIVDSKLLTDDKTILQSINNEDSYFTIYTKNYDGEDKLYLNKVTGEYSKTPIPVEVQANEVIWFYRSDLGGNECGVPLISSNIDLINLDQARTQYLLDFFVNFGMPSWIVTISGNFHSKKDAIEKMIAKQIQNIIKGGRHGAIVMSFPVKAGSDPVSINVIPLANDTKEASFRGLRVDTKEDICSSMGISSNLIGPSSQGAMGNNALDSEYAQHNDNKVKPTQRKYIGAFNKLLLYENVYFKHDVRNIKLVLLDFIQQNLADEIETDLKLLNNGVMTRREFIDRHGKHRGLHAADDNPLLDVYLINGRPEYEVFYDNDEFDTLLSNLEGELLLQANKSIGDNCGVYGNSFNGKSRKTNAQNIVEIIRKHAKNRI